MGEETGRGVTEARAQQQPEDAHTDKAQTYMDAVNAVSNWAK